MEKGEIQFAHLSLNLLFNPASLGSVKEEAGQEEEGRKKDDIIRSAFEEICILSHFRGPSTSVSGQKLKRLFEYYFRHFPNLEAVFEQRQISLKQAQTFWLEQQRRSSLLTFDQGWQRFVKAYNSSSV